MSTSVISCACLQISAIDIACRVCGRSGRKSSTFIDRHQPCLPHLCCLALPVLASTVVCMMWHEVWNYTSTQTINVIFGFVEYVLIIFSTYFLVFVLPFLLASMLLQCLLFSVSACLFVSADPYIPGTRCICCQSSYTTTSADLVNYFVCSFTNTLQCCSGHKHTVQFLI